MDKKTPMASPMNERKLDTFSTESDDTLENARNSALERYELRQKLEGNTKMEDALTLLE